MAQTKIFLYPFPKVTEDQHYQCPCKKTYKSYPALYTHIKNKHQGKPPGPIVKPALPPRKKGRPANKSRTSLESQLSIRSLSQICASPSETEDECFLLSPSGQDCLIEISEILNRFPSQQIRRQRINEMPVVTEMIVFMSATIQRKQIQCIGTAVTDFLKSLSGAVVWQKFSQFYTLVMVFLQYISNQHTFLNVLQDLSPDSLCDFINDFIREGASKMAESYEISQLSIMEDSNMMQIFSWFFRWMNAKNYSSYKVFMNQSFSRAKTRAQI